MTSSSLLPPSKLKFLRFVQTKRVIKKFIQLSDTVPPKVTVSPPPQNLSLSCIL